MIDTKWHERYLHLAETISSWSKDPSRKIGAVAVGSKGQILSQGYNGFPRGVVDSDDRLNERSTKYSYVVHAELNCIYNASLNGVSLEGSTLYVYGLPICNECAKGIIQSGIKTVWMKLPPGGDPRWRESWEVSKQMFTESGLDYHFLLDK